MKTLLQSKRFWLLGGLFFSLLAGLNSLSFFNPENGAYGLETGQNHGTPADASLIKDSYSAGGASFPANLTIANDMLVFAAYNSPRGQEVPGLNITSTVYLPLVFNINAIIPWIGQPSNTSTALNDISCPSTTICFAVGNGGLILKTTDGGAAWNPLNSNTGVNLAGVSCPTTTTCFAAGDSGTILKTTDGASWIPLNSGTGQPLRDISCPTVTNCFAVGGAEPITSTSIFTKNGTSWQATPKLGNAALYGVHCPGASTCILVGQFGRIQVLNNDALVGSFTLDGGRLFGVHCSSFTSCFAVGEFGRIYSSTSPATHWTKQNSGLSLLQHVQGVTCTSSTDCYVVGVNGLIRATNDGGMSWKTEPSNTTGQLNDVTCASATVCRAVGQGGVIRARS